MGTGLPCCSRQDPCCWGSILQGEWSLVGVMNLAFFFGVWGLPFAMVEFAVMLWHAIENSLKQNLIHSLYTDMKIFSHNSYEMERWTIENFK
jgi:hypothetical protein